jgi:hypothetical protein
MGLSFTFFHITHPKKSLKILLGMCLSLVIFLVSACQPSAPACPPGSVTYLLADDSTQMTTEQENSDPDGQLVEINGKEIWVDQLVQGMLCSGSWHGTVFIPCQVQVYAWEEEPLFLKNCDLSIAPGTVVYVEAHNNEPYYQGCSCHTGEVEN